jgi:hypothetical protein
MASKGKDSKVELSTFLSWGKESIIGYKTENVDNRVFVNFAFECHFCSPKLQRTRQEVCLGIHRRNKLC